MERCPAWRISECPYITLHHLYLSDYRTVMVPRRPQWGNSSLPLLLSRQIPPRQTHHRRQSSRNPRSSRHLFPFLRERTSYPCSVSISPSKFAHYVEWKSLNADYASYDRASNSRANAVAAVSSFGTNNSAQVHRKTSDMPPSLDGNKVLMAPKFWPRRDCSYIYLPSVISISIRFRWSLY